MRSRFDEQLAQLERELIEMGALCEESIALAAKSLGDGSLARQVAPLDTEIDRKERDIESLGIDLLMVAKYLERIGDQAEDIAEIVISGQVNEGEELLRDMTASTIKMVTESVDAYVKHDTMLAEKVIAEDDIVDGWFDRVKHTLIRRMTADPGEGERAVDLLMIAKYFERIGDHAVNVAQWVIFSVTGTHKEG